MDLSGIVTIISTVGFPIAMCLIMMWYILKLTTEHKEESRLFTEALNKNTLVIQKVCDKLNIESEV